MLEILRLFGIVKYSFWYNVKKAKCWFGSFMIEGLGTQTEFSWEKDVYGTWVLSGLILSDGWCDDDDGFGNMGTGIQSVLRERGR